MAGEVKKNRVYFFKKGNTWSKGRPVNSLSKPDVLLPAIFRKAGINWANDFTKLYKESRKRQLDTQEMLRFKMLYELLPYLIAKVQLKEDDLKKFLDQGASVKAARATSDLLKSLEQETNAKPETTSRSSSTSVGTGQPLLPPPSQPA